MSPYPKAYGRYVLEERIAMGGMAEIFRARTATEGFEKRVCIKRVLPHFLEDEEFVTMFRDEARTAARLQHANVVQVFDFGTEEGALYLAMELVDGADLRRILEASRKKGIPFEIGEAVQIAIDMCKGLHHAHTLLESGSSGRSLGLVHRDVSPHNVLLSRAGEVKVTDFGIAKAAERATHTSTGIVKGKVAYMAPEQAQGLPFDHRLDQFATGIVLWEMLVGTRMFTGENDAVILKKVLAGKIVAPSVQRKDVPPALDNIVLKALSQDPNGRFTDMRGLELALARFLFSGAIDPATAEVRNMFPRIMASDRPEPRKTQVADARPILPALESTATPPDVDQAGKTESEPPKGSGPAAASAAPEASEPPISMPSSAEAPATRSHGGAAASPAEASAAPSRAQSSVSMVFASSEKLDRAPGPEGPEGRVAHPMGLDVDPNAVTVLELSGEGLRAPGRAPVSTEPGLPSMAELVRLEEASEALRPAPESTPATRTNVPRATAVTVVPAVAARVVDAKASAASGAASAPARAESVDDIEALAIPRSRAPLVAAGVVVALATGALAIRWAREQVEEPTAARSSVSPISAGVAVPVVAARPPEAGPVAPVVLAQPRVVDAQPGEVAPVEEAQPVAPEPASPKPGDAKLIVKKARKVDVLVKTAARWVYFVSPTGERIEISTAGTRMKLPEGKGRFKLVTKDEKPLAVNLEVIEGKTLIVPTD